MKRDLALLNIYVKRMDQYRADRAALALTIVKPKGRPPQTVEQALAVIYQDRVNAAGSW